MKKVNLLLILFFIFVFSCSKDKSNNLNEIRNLYNKKKLNTIINKFSNIQTDNVLINFYLAKAYFFLSDNDKNLKKSEKLFLKIIKLNPYFTQAYLYLSRINFYYTKNYNKAIYYAKRVLNYEPQNIEANILLFKIYKFIDNKEKAGIYAKYILLYEKDIKEANQFFSK